MQTGLFHFPDDEAGAIAIEYALIAGGIALVIVSAVAALGGAVSGTFSNISASML